MSAWVDALRELSRRRGRSLVSLLSVVIAVAAVVAVRAATDTTRAAYQRVYQALAGRADLEVVASGGGRFDQSVADSIRKLPGVRAAVPVFQRATIFYAHKDRIKVLLLGIDPAEPESLAGFQLSSGHMPEADQLLLETRMAESLHLGVGDKVHLMTSRGLRPLTISGLVSLDSTVQLRQGGMLLGRLDQAQALFRARGKVDALHLFLKPGADPGQVQSAVAGLLPAQLTVRVPSARSGLAEETLLLTEVSLNMASALSFTTAVFIALGVFLMNVGERRKQLSVLRAIGATRRQIIGTVCREALVLGIAGTLLGIPAGLYGGRLLTTTMAGMLDATLPETATLNTACLLGLLLGPAICLLAAWYPARQASLVSPLEGLRPLVTRDPGRSYRALTLLGLLGSAVSTILAVACAQGKVSPGVAVSTVVLSLVSLTLLIPCVLGFAVRWLGWPLERLLGLEAEMAERAVLRHAGRSSLTIGVLFIAVAAGIGTSNAVFSITDDVQEWYERSFTADFMLRTMMLDASGPDAVTIPESLSEQLNGLPGVEWFYTLRLLRVEAGGQQSMLVVHGFPQEKHEQAPATSSSASDSVGEVMRRGEVVIGSVLAHHVSLGVGDMLDIALGTEHHSFRIGQVVNEYAFGGSIIYIDRREAEKWFPVSGVDTFLIKAEHPVPPALEKSLNRIAEEHGLLLQSFAGYLASIDATVNGVTGGLWALLILALLVGALGVINTLTMNVLEQDRELAMLRAIGMHPRQLVKSVAAQALVIGLLGALPGAAVGLLLARMINLCLGSIFGHYVHFAVRPLSIVLLLAAALAVVLLAAWFPARRAVRLNPIQAMRME